MKKLLVVSCLLLVVGYWSAVVGQEAKKNDVKKDSVAAANVDTTQIKKLDDMLVSIEAMFKDNDMKIQQLNNTIISSKSQIYDILVGNQDMQRQKQAIEARKKQLLAEAEKKNLPPKKEDKKESGKSNEVKK